MNACPKCHHELQVDEYSVIHIDMGRIYSCIKFSVTTTLLELVENIKRNGLCSPIVVQPAFDAEDLPCGYDFNIVEGHFRLAACKMSGMITVPCTIKFGLSVSDVDFIQSLSTNVKGELE
jgi:ParB-like chromosome segregation protein Spo0J